MGQHARSAIRTRQQVRDRSAEPASGTHGVIYARSMSQSIPVFVGYDARKRAATNVLMDSLYQHSSAPLAITPLVTPQLERAGLYQRERDPKQATAFSFTRFLVPSLMGYQGLVHLPGLRHAVPRWYRGPMGSAG